MHIDLSGCLLKHDFEPQSILDKISIYSFSTLTLFLLKQLRDNSMDVHIKVAEWPRVLYKKYAVEGGPGRENESFY